MTTIDLKTKQGLPVYCIDTFRSSSQERKAGFDIKVLEKLVNDFQFTSQPHRHDFYNILFIREGTGTHTIDFVTYEVKPCSKLRLFRYINSGYFCRPFSQSLD